MWCKHDQCHMLYCPTLQDAMETTAQSEDKSIAEELLHFFVDAGEKEAFAAMLFTCYDLIQPDVALEVLHSSVSMHTTLTGLHLHSEVAGVFAPHHSLL